MANVTTLLLLLISPVLAWNV